MPVIIGAWPRGVPRHDREDGRGGVPAGRPQPVSAKPSGCSWIFDSSPPTDFGRSGRRSTRSTSTSGGGVPRRTPGTDNRALLVCRLLNRARVRYLVAGAVAGHLHGVVRATRDVDLLIPRDPDNTARLLQALSALPYRIAAELDPDEVATKPFTIIGDDPRVDLLTVAASVTFEQAYPRRIIRTIDGVRIPHLSREDYVRSKQTGRPQDVADLEQLGSA
jgi:hypothetical protein